MHARIVLLVLLFSSFSLAQSNNPSVDLYAGYSYLNLDTNGLTNRLNANGWEAGASFNLYRYLAVEADGAGYYKNNVLGSQVNVTNYSIAGGPRFNYRYVFAHSLFGVDRLTGSALGLSASQNSFAVVLGGGLQVPVAPHWAVRAGVDWALTHHNILGGPRVDQNNFRAGGGIVFTFGRRQLTQTSNAQGPGCGTMASSPHPVTLDQIGLKGAQNTYGFRIDAVAPGSPAASAGLIEGDFIVSVNCIKVHTAAELVDLFSRVANPALVEVNKATALPNQTQIHRLQVQP